MSTINAAADEVPAVSAVEAPASSAAVETPEPIEPGLLTPPALLPWGAKPTPVKVGELGDTSAELAAQGADVAPTVTTEDVQPEAGYFPKGDNDDRPWRQGRTSRRNVAPPLPPKQGLDDPVKPVKPASSKYQYAGAWQFGESEGSFANLVIGKPTLGEGEYHTLAEIAVQDATQSSTIEVGWTVDPGLNKKSLEPHLFVYRWTTAEGKKFCYNDCGWTQYSERVAPGMVLPTGSKRFGIQHAGNAWWISYDSEWIGYFNDSEWDYKYKKAGLTQWFGEVASNKNPLPCSAMGTGKPADDTGAARFGTINYINGPEPAFETGINGVDEYGKEIPASGNYSVKWLGDRTIRYGGGPHKSCATD